MLEAARIIKCGSTGHTIAGILYVVDVWYRTKPEKRDGGILQHNSSLACTRQARGDDYFEGGDDFKQKSSPD